MRFPCPFGKFNEDRTIRDAHGPKREEVMSPDTWRAGRSISSSAWPATSGCHATVPLCPLQ